MLKYQIAFLLFVLSFSTWANNFGFRQITNRDGLTQNDVLCIFQDSRGFLWFATNDGLNRYDGKEFKTYRRGAGELSSGLTRGLAEDKSNNLWIATIDNGINKLNFQTGKIEQFFHSPKENVSLNSNKINNIISDKEGIIYYSTNLGVGKIIEQEGKTRIINLKHDSNSSSFYRKARLYVDDNNKLWLMSGRGLYYYEQDSLQIYFQIPGGQIKEMDESKDHYIFGTSIGAFAIRKDENVPENYAPVFFAAQACNELIVDNAQSVWLGNNAGVKKYIPSSTASAYKIDDLFERDPKNRVRKVKVLSFFKDRTGILYVGTNGAGLIKINPNGKKFRHYELNDAHSGNKIRAIYQDSKENIYIGKEEGKLFLLPANNPKDYEHGFVHQWASMPNEINQPVFAINEVTDPLGKKNVIGGSDTNYSFLRLSENKMSLPNLNARIFAIAQGANGLIWIGTYNQGLFRFDPSGKLPLKSFTKEASNGYLLSNIIRSLCFDSKNRLWIGTEKGINVLLNEEQNEESPSFIRIENNKQADKNLKYNYILPIYESKSGKIWIGTMGGGLSLLTRFEPQTGLAEFENFTTKDGLPNNVVKAILEDDSQNLWISTNRGLCRFNPKDNNFENYDINDGLQDFEFSELAAFKLTDGEMLFGGVNGINAFYPDEIINDSSQAQPVLTNLTVLNKSVTVGETLNDRVLLEKDINDIGILKLNYPENSFAVQFASLHFSHPEKNKCMYKLVNFDNDWVIAPSGEVAKYTNLKPGKYILEIKAANGDGIWGKEVKRLEIVIAPPFLLLWQMQILYVVLLAFVFLFFRKFTIINATRKHELLIKEIEKKKEQEINQLKFQFFTNISHEFRTPLTLIVNPLEQLTKNETLPSEKILRNHLFLILRNAKVLLRLINQLMDFRKIDQGKMKLNNKESDLKGFLADIHKSFSILAKAKNIAFNFVSHSNYQNICFDQDKLEKVIYNILSNAFKFTKENGTINLELIDHDNAYVTIIITDSGIGIPEEAKKNIFDLFFQLPSPDAKTQPGTGIGLSYTKSLIELMNGTIQFKSKLGAGTTFYINLPKNNDAFNEDDIKTKKETSSFPGKDYFLYENIVPLATNKLEPLTNESLCTILLVEDNNDLRYYLRDYFSSNYNIIEASNGLEGYNKCIEYTPDIIITDITMPEMDGIRMTHKIKESYETSHIPIIMLTAQIADEQQKVGLRTGADAYLSKPFNVDILSAQVLSLLTNRQRLRAKFMEKLTVLPSEISPSKKDEIFIGDLLQIIENKISDPEFTVQKLASEYGCSQTSLNKKLLALTGKKAKIFIRSIRLKRSAQLIKQGELSIAEITYNVGFNDLHYFRKCFVEEFGCLPSEYLKQSKNKS